MNGMMRVTVVAACVMMLGFTAQAQKEALGTWDVTFDYNGTEIASSISIAQNSDGELVGLWIRGEEWTNLTDVKFENGKLTFNRELEMQGQTIALKNEATFDGEKVTGKIISPQGELAFAGAKRGLLLERRRRGRGGSGGERQGFDIGAVIRSADKDGDGLLQKSEAPDQLQQFFDMMDTNGDGGISVEEGEEAMKRFNQ